MIATQMVPGDLAELIPQAEQAGTIDLSPERGAILIGAGPAFSVRDDGRLIFIGGLIDQGDGRAMCWSRIATIGRRTFVPLTQMVDRVIAVAGFRRIETVVRTGFAGGHSWVRRLGFTREATMRAWGPTGEDFDLYARVREGEHHG